MNVIEIHIKEVPQLFDSRDPAPFHERDLDSSFANYLIACAEESKSRSKYFRIRIDIDERHPTIDEENISAAIHSYFKYQIELKRLEFTRIMRMARLFLLFGLIILFLCLSIAQVLQYIESDFIKTSLREGVVIFGWVSLWKPLEVFLFDWYPIYDKIRLYRKIFASQINILFNAKETL